MLGDRLMYIINATMTDERNCVESLDVYLRPYAVAIGHELILMDDNAWCTNGCLIQNIIYRMDRSAMSLDIISQLKIRRLINSTLRC